MLLDRADPQSFVLKALREAGSSIISEMYDVDEELLDVSPADGVLCLKEIAAHMRDMEELALTQMAAIAEGSRRALPAWDVDLLPLEREYRSEDVEVFLSEFRGLRRETTSFPSWTERKGSENGRETEDVGATRGVLRDPREGPGEGRGVLSPDVRVEHRTGGDAGVPQH
jgi:hypothetical protein